MADKVYLFTSGHVSYGVITSSERRARAYMKQTHRGMDLRFAGEDTRTWQQQAESNTIGVVVPADWQPPIVPKNALEDKWLGEYVRFSLLGEIVIGKVVAANVKEKTLTVEFMYDSAVVQVVDSHWHFAKGEQGW